MTRRPDRFPTLYVLRHGETFWNLEHRMQGGKDSGLTARGREQALQQGQILRACGADAGGIALWSSPQGRALDTARLALPGRAVQTDPRLLEVGLGTWQGLTMDEIRQRWPGVLDERHAMFWKFDAPGGELFEAMRDRVEAFLLGVRGPSVIVTHGITSRLLRGIVLGLDQQGMADLPGGQGVVYRLQGGQQDRLTL